MIREIATAGRVDADICVPGSKSITNRALVCASLAPGTSTITGASDSDDTMLLANGLNQMGVLVRRVDDGLRVEGTGGRLFAPKVPIPVGNAGTTTRFLIALAALAQGTTVLQADLRMAARPMNEIFDALRALGVQAAGGGTAPRYTVQGGTIGGAEVPVSAERSSQFLSALLLIAPLVPGGLTVVAQGVPASRPYVDMTVAVMEKFGVAVHRRSHGAWGVTETGGYLPARYAVEPDASGASYFFAAAAILGGSVTVRGMRRRSVQGDTAVLDILERMGCRTEETVTGVRVSGDGVLRGVDVDMHPTPDLVPTIAVTSLFAAGETRLRNVGHLRFKESDRLEALLAEVGRAGGRMDLEGDDLRITPSPLRGAQFDTYEDHRLAMSVALIGLKVPGVSVENPDVVRKSFPTFWEEFGRLYGG